jgi:tellurite resistance protein
MSFGLLVGRFGTFVRESHTAMEAGEAAPPFPDQLNQVRHAIAHHLIPLALLARCDGEFAPEERNVIVTHCVSVAGRRGIDMDAARTALLVEYVSEYRPTLMQLDPALSRLAESTHSELLELVEAAHAVVDADGMTRDAEKRFLITLGEELRALPGGA